MSDLLRAKFAVGDRVAALPDTLWDDDLEGFTDSEHDYVRLHGHHGRVVDGCGSSDCIGLHVKWVGVHDGRTPGPTSWTDGTPWHMKPDEIEHID